MTRRPDLHSSDRDGTLSVRDAKSLRKRSRISQDFARPYFGRPSVEVPVSGRPRMVESARRAQEMLARMAAGERPKDAARNAHVKPERVLTLLGDDAFFAAFQAVRECELGVGLLEDEAEAA